MPLVKSNNLRVLRDAPTRVDWIVHNLCLPCRFSTQLERADYVTGPEKVTSCGI